MAWPQMEEKLLCTSTVPKAPWTRAPYVVFRPLPEGLASGPSTLSAGLTCWNCKGWRASILVASELFPLNGRPAHDISIGLLAGPSDWEASDELVIVTSTPSVLLPVSPNGLKPLKVWLARPSQKLSRLKTALMTLGALRPVTWRLVPVTVQSSWATVGFGSTWTNSAATTPFETGLTSSPAWKWHEAHACWPSPPACWSQNRALPSWTAAAWLTMVPPVGWGGSRLLSGARPLPPPLPPLPL